MNYYKRSLFLGFTILVEAASAQIGCRNSTFVANLNTTLSSLYTNIDNNGFYKASGGQGTDRAYGILLCRGDAQLSECRKCAQTAAADTLNQTCPIEKQQTRYVGDSGCILRYSNNTISGALSDSPRIHWWNNGSASSPEQFEVATQTLLDDLTNQAASGGSLRKVAAGNRTGPDFQRIFAMVQCTPDLSPQNCSSCLIRATADIPLHCKGKIGCRVFWPSCNLRFEVSPFINETRLQELQPAPVIPPPPPGKNDGNNSKIAIAVVVPIVVCLILAVSSVIFLRKKKQPQIPREDPQIGAPEPVQYSFPEIKAATNNFDNELGKGGFGTVYKGKLPNDREIAVKRLSKNSGQGDLEFKNEVLFLAKLQHRNLVRLIGFALQGTERLLVYEFVKNKSLDLFISDPIKRTHLNWERRNKIICGTARGINYLHEEYNSESRIIHRDLKPGNILLDGDMNPKIADFGVARLFGQDKTRGNTSRIVGTLGLRNTRAVLY